MNSENKALKLLIELIEQSQDEAHKLELIDLLLFQAERSIRGETPRAGRYRISGSELSKWVGQHKRKPQLRLINNRNFSKK